MPLTDWLSSVKGILMPCENLVKTFLRPTGRVFWILGGERGVENGRLQMEMRLDKGRVVGTQRGAYARMSLMS